MQNYNGEAKRNIAKYQSRNLMLMLSFYPKKKEKRPTHTKSNNNNNKKKNHKIPHQIESITKTPKKDVLISTAVGRTACVQAAGFYHN